MGYSPESDMTERLTHSLTQLSSCLLCYLVLIMGFPGGSDGKESACIAGDRGLVHRLGRSPGEGKATHSSILAWRIPCTEEPGELESTGSQKSQTQLSD